MVDWMYILTLINLHVYLCMKKKPWLSLRLSFPCFNNPGMVILVYIQSLNHSLTLTRKMPIPSHFCYWYTQYIFSFFPVLYFFPFFLIRLILPVQLFFHTHQQFILFLYQCLFDPKIGGADSSLIMTRTYKTKKKWMCV